jgi:hypothetical protein
VVATHVDSTTKQTDTSAVQMANHESSAPKNHENKESCKSHIPSVPVLSLQTGTLLALIAGLILLFSGERDQMDNHPFVIPADYFTNYMGPIDLLRKGRKFIDETGMGKRD